jgi:hypothetical protein
MFYMIVLAPTLVTKPQFFFSNSFQKNILKLMMRSESMVSWHLKVHNLTLTNFFAILTIIKP